MLSTTISVYTSILTAAHSIGQYLLYHSEVYEIKDSYLIHQNVNHIHRIGCTRKIYNTILNEYLSDTEITQY